jgi:hypothetical protein
MAYSEDYLQDDGLHPIDIVETLAADHDWDFDRLTEDQIAMSVEGQWRSYAITLAWSAQDEVLRLIVTFEMDPPSARLDALHDLLNRVNDQVWTGAFTYWREQRLMVWRYGLVLKGVQTAVPEQIVQMIGGGVAAAERFYPAFQLACWGDETPEAAMQVAIAEAYGRA